ncbi:hypothetical protein GCM10010277_11140 [Streptomyces longisporoflavus]|uniref:hypothetical protein n=1 Tax=Streptomyces longisporoflavus TaxID=28044 RepID=UPI00167E13DA|nr:hypothetical protein [Streptomyces longisporoflavus]GGV28743.1 hypothetical protein GCM10010277_11140 [Streptomyces longisporoflavus]
MDGHERSALTEQECRELLASTPAAHLSAVHRGRPFIELVDLIHFDGELVALLPDDSDIARALSTVISPRRLVAMQTDDLTEAHRWVRSVTVVARPRWIVGVEGLRACRRAAAACGLYAPLDAWFLALTHPALSGHRTARRAGHLRLATTQAPKNAVAR